MIVAEDVAKFFVSGKGRRYVVRNLSFEMPQNGHLAILGAENTGKSTVLNLIGGLDHPDRGKIRCFGTISWPFGQVRFEQSMSPLQNLRFICRVLGERDLKAHEARLKELTELGDVLREPVKSLRPVQKRLISIAMSLLFDFDILLFDGPVQFGRPDFKERFQPILDEKIGRAMAVMTTANPRHITEVYSHVLVLSDGTGRLYDDPRDAIRVFKKLRQD